MKEKINNIIKQLINDPMKIEIKLSKIVKLDNPPIKLPDHTPVKGKGIATNNDNKIIDLIFEFF